MKNDVISTMIEGFKEFHRRFYVERPDFFDTLIEEGQSPKVMLIGCSDSRVTPSSLYGKEPGSIFVVRNIANLVPPAEQDGHLHGTSAAVDFAVSHLGVEHIIVNGHSHCGGIKALLNNTEGKYIGPWVSIAKDARSDVLREYGGASPEEQAAALEKASILVSLENLLTFDSVRRRVVRGELQLHGWYFDMEEGALLAYDVKRQKFDKLA
ncbi:carbonic anhydrase [Acidithiobacillus sp. M4-SHS-6]|uniref:carbonic anhydrase n=1 Tax=Acidithiobacillus sp. M4-SHS-6 TaxID=3383024 RepID=UPI0039BE1469